MVSNTPSVFSHRDHMIEGAEDAVEVDGFPSQNVLLNEKLPSHVTCHVTCHVPHHVTSHVTHHVTYHVTYHVT